MVHDTGWPEQLRKWKEMSETEWLSSESPRDMLAFLAERSRLRKLRLFGVACCRRVWQDLLAVSRDAVETVERFADGRADLGDLRLAYHNVYDEVLVPE